ncbi:UNVERIFIED_CONTAM: adenylate kinase family enzyme [Paenibacillus sp. PvR008]
MDDISYDLQQQYGTPPREDQWLHELEQWLRQPHILTEGFYKTSIERRFCSADVLIYFDIPLRICMFRAMQRGLRNLWSAVGMKRPIYYRK